MVEGGSRATVLVFKFIIEIILSFLVLGCSVFSKLSIAGLIDNLKEISNSLLNLNGTNPDTETVSRGVSIYWQLLLILWIPNALTFLRCLFFGTLGKSIQNFPFPSGKALLTVSNYKEFDW